MRAHSTHDSLPDGAAAAFTWSGVHGFSSCTDVNGRASYNECNLNRLRRPVDADVDAHLYKTQSNI